LKAKLAKLKSELLIGDSGGAGGGSGEAGFDVARAGDARVALIGFPSVGKSSLLNTITDTNSEAAGYEFTTLTCIPGNLYYKGTRIQVLDLPGIIEGAARGKGRGKEVIAVARSADLVLMVLDAQKEGLSRHREILEGELESVGIRLNKQPPDVTLVKKPAGGVKINSTLPLTRLGDDPQATCANILKQYKISNAEVLFREDIDIDQFIDVILGNRKYVRCLYTYNKIDTITIEEIDTLARNDHSTVISVANDMNLDYLKDNIWEYLALTRIFTKRRGQPPDLAEPVVLSRIRKGTTVQSLCENVSKHMLRDFAFAMVWGVSAKHTPQRCGLSHPLLDQDVVQVVTKTVGQQKNDKNYQALVESFNTTYKNKKKKAEALKKKKLGKMK
jgi:small GTP-binding protein